MRSLTRDTERQIVSTLAALQGERTDTEMGALVGCSRVHWWSLKNDRKSMSYGLARKASASFPQVTRLLMRELVEPVEQAS